eukprot:69518-Rhodomonas_salina.1
MLNFAPRQLLALFLVGDGGVSGADGPGHPGSARRGVVASHHGMPVLGRWACSTSSSTSS